MKKTLHKKYHTTEKVRKNVNNLENYITQNLSDDIWWKKRNVTEDTKQFLEKKVKASKVIPEKMETSREIPDNLGYFESQFGTISVGYKKYKKNSDIAFSLIPEKVKHENRIEERDKNSPNTYFGGEMKKKDKKFKVSKISFKYNMNTEKIEKFEKDNDGIIDSEQNLLYEDEEQTKKIEKIKSLKSVSTIEEKFNESKQENSLRKIRSEQQKDNDTILKEIKNFIKKIKKEKLRKIIESDETISRAKRMEFYDDEIIILKNLLKKLISEMYEKKSYLTDFDIDVLDKKALKKMIENLKNKLD